MIINFILTQSDIFILTKSHFSVMICRFHALFHPILWRCHARIASDCLVPHGDRILDRSHGNCRSVHRSRARRSQTEFWHHRRFDGSYSKPLDYEALVNQSFQRSPMSEDNFSPLQKLALRALTEITTEHIVQNIGRLKTQHSITDGTRMSGDRTVFYIVIDGDCLVEARVSVHGEQNGRHLVTVYVITYRLPDSNTLHSPHASFEDTFAL